MKTFKTIPLIFLFVLQLFQFQALSQDTDMRLFFRFNQYDYQKYNLLIFKKDFFLKDVNQEISIKNSTWIIELDSIKQQNGMVRYSAKFICRQGSFPSASVSFGFTDNNWDESNYVLMPGAVYNGNRFESRKIRYAPKLMHPRDIGPNKPTIITDVLRLSKDDSFSRIQTQSGNMATPSVGYFSKKQKLNTLIYFSQGNELGDYGVDITENRKRDEAEVLLTSPLVRQLYRYTNANAHTPSYDIPHDFTKGDTIEISFRMIQKNSQSIQELFDLFAQTRKIFMKGEIVNTIPYANAFKIQEKKFNEQNFVPEFGYYAVGMRHKMGQDWQIGWTGGLISTYPLLFAGNKNTKQRVIKNFDWVFGQGGISPSGYFSSFFYQGKWYMGTTREPHTHNWHLVRRSGDALYYSIKQFMLMEKMGIEVKALWKKQLLKVVNAFSKTWNEWGQLGQFVDSQTGDIIVGGSSSGAIAPTGIALAADYYEKPEFLELAKEIGEFYYSNFVKHGITNGGPGDALQNPDSESAYGMIESFIVLYELTNEQKWLNRAGKMARQFSSWVYSYDYQFPEGSLFHRLDIHTRGAVYANTQNRHGSPGICTFSGLALLKLYHYTKDTFYIDLIRDIAHNLPQYLSREDRPVGKLPPGWMNERVNTTDWEGKNKIGGIFRGSTWAETSLMLTYIEIPGIYIDVNNKLIRVFDNVDAKVLNFKKNTVTLEVSNPFNSKTEITTLLSSDFEIIGQNALINAQKISLKPNETKKLRLKY